MFPANQSGFCTECNEGCVVSDANGPLVGVVIHDKDNAKVLPPICRESMRSMALNQAIQ